jgi:hypothetical protein
VPERSEACPEGQGCEAAAAVLISYLLKVRWQPYQHCAKYDRSGRAVLPSKHLGKAAEHLLLGRLIDSAEFLH